MAPMIGRTLGHYRIDSKLGEGGMGVVYKARDTHLDRFVAIKVLPPEKTTEAERKRRFLQEAKAASALNHPNILHVYDVETAGDLDFIAMEYFEGQTLADLIGRKGLSVRDTLRYAVQVADGLAVAHGAGIVHRDIKPGNIMINEKGLIKILDFGLAKLTDLSEGGEFGSTQTMRPATEKGTIVGTVAYMSPEQAQGKHVDSRSDIFSFGSVLYEMLTGRRAFQGDSQLSILAAIVRDQPAPVNEIRPGAPREVERIVTYCLRKDPQRRLQRMDDVKILLEELAAEPESGKLSSPPYRPRRASPATVISTILILVACAVLALRLTTPRRETLQPMRGPVLTRLTSDVGLSTQPVVSPKGDLLAYASDRGGEGNLDIWIQQIGGGQPLRLTRNEADDDEPAFSPDGTRIAFHSGRDGGGIYVVPALGGEERLIARQGREPKFSPDGSQILYWIGHDFGKAFIVPSIGGTPRPVRPEFYSVRNPIWSPDGKWILFHGSKDRNELIESDSYDWWASESKGETLVRTGAVSLLRREGLAPSARVFLPDTWLAENSGVVFSARLGDTTNLWELPISSASGRVSGAPLRLTFGAGMDVSAAASAPNGLVFASLDDNTDVWGLPLDADRAKVQGALHQWTNNLVADSQPSLSSDGKQMLFTSTRLGNSDIWWKDLQTGKEAPLTLAPLRETAPKITRDGAAAAYAPYDGSRWSIDFVKISSRGGTIQSGAPEKPCEDCGLPYGWSSDGKRLLYAHLGPPAHVRMIDLTSRRTLELLRHSESNVWGASFSPDNRWIVFPVQQDSSGGGVYLAPFRDGLIPPTDWIPLGNIGDGNFEWSPNGQILYMTQMHDGFRCLGYQRLDSATKRPVGQPEFLYHLHHARLSMTNLSGPQRAISVARDKIVFTISELTGSIWMAKPEGHR
jgi:serine/threonine protein kinase/Tol biopolymer transport system component